MAVTKMSSYKSSDIKAYLSNEVLVIERNGMISSMKISMMMIFLFWLVFFLVELLRKNSISVFVLIILLLFIGYNLYHVIKEISWMRSFKRLILEPSNMIIKINNKSHTYKNLTIKFIEFYGVTETSGVPFKRSKIVVNFELDNMNNRIIIDREARQKKVTVLKEILVHLGIRYEELYIGK
ncbi:MAG: hypothetical protein L6Q78_14620 [Bacteroidia bacterium]|nr:hypothetical protein [Bacteroidia bacterium]